MKTKPWGPRLALVRASVLSAAFLLGTAGAQDAPFYDLSETHWAYESVRDLAELGILTGYPDGRFDGTRATTRYEVAVVAARLLNYMDGVTGGAGTREGSAAAASGEPLSARVAALETALGGTPSLDYTERLEARVAALERTLSVQGTDGTPRPIEAPDDAVALSTGASAEVAEATPIALDAGPLVEVRFSRRPTYPFFVGISPGVVSTAGDVYLSVQAGYDALLGPVGPAARLTFNGGNRELRFSVDGLAKADLLLDTLKLYGGLGLGATVRPGGGSLLLEAPFGGEYFVTERVSLFLQLTTSYGFAPISDVDAELSTGINLRF